MKILLCSDAHPDAVTAGFPRFDDVEAALFEAVNRAIDERVDVFGFLGDLCDPDRGRAHEAAALAIQASDRLRRAGIAQVWLTGNHDVLEDGSGTSTLQPLAAHIGATQGDRGFEGETAGGVVSRPMAVAVGDHDVAIVCLPYVARSHAYDPEKFVREVSDAKRVVVLSHLMIDGIDPGSESIELARGRDVFLPVDAILGRWGDRALMFAGHYHRRQVHRGVRIVGSLVRLTFDEGDHRPGYVLVEA